MAMPFSLILFFLASLIAAETVTFDWNVGWVTAAPDGYARPVIGVNGQWPWPVMECNVGDTLVVTVNNNLGNETTSIHFHGQYQNGTNDMDGVALVNQCPIPSGSRFTHVFTANPAGTRWYHAHDTAQYPDGLRAPMIVHDLEWEASLGFDEQFIFSVSDWFHEQMPQLIAEYLDGDTWDGNNFMDQMPMATSSLINDTTSITIDIEPNKKYLIRMVSVAALFSHTVSFEDHEMTIVAVDGEPVNATSASAVTIAAGQRYDVLITGMSNPTRNYAITSVMTDTTLQANGILSYGKNFSNPAPLNGISESPIDDITLENAIGQELLNSVTQNIALPVSYTGAYSRRINLGNGTYITPKVPTLYSALTTGENASNPAVYGFGINPYLISSGETIQIVVTNGDDIEHPMHLHGHEFQLIARGSGTWNGDTSNVPQYPLVRDTATTPPSGYLVIRFQANNPGVWMFHCHMEFHVAAGMMVTIIESPLILQHTLKVSQAALDICKQQNIPTAGNCAGNTVDVLDTSQCNNNPSEDEETATNNDNTYGEIESSDSVEGASTTSPSATSSASGSTASQIMSAISGLPSN